MTDRRDRYRDEWLIVRARDGDRAALERLVERWQRRLWQHAFRLTGREAAASDVVQETWLVVTRALGRLRDPARFRAWVFAIVTRRAASRRRDDGRFTELDDADRIATRPTDASEPVERLRDALRRLDGEDRALLALKYQDGFDIAEIGRILDIPEGTAKSRLFHARQRLRAILERTDG